ncbi:MAG: single-stranded DNA-binding protein [Magnetococcales bacterium]|nr:single-stranded DNA-binding protein [Magnetococcales bacterium]MBF0149451.1 single-stranded DNA-binding protein [Magnetococcales bacterium]MBF0632287.1 single-stranded DNA-binding protein [Magnetococcales bacterium]
MSQDPMHRKDKVIDVNPSGHFLNELHLEGTLAKSCELRHTPTGLAVATVELEHTSGYSDIAPLQRLELNIPVVLFDTLADLYGDLAAGTRISVIGRLNQKRWIRDDRIRWGQVEVIATSLKVIPNDPPANDCAPQTKQPASQQRLT